MTKTTILHTLIMCFGIGMHYQTILPCDRPASPTAAAAVSIDLATIFSEPNLALCNPQQKPHTVQQYFQRPDFNIDVFLCDETPQYFALATVSFLINPDRVLIKTMAINPNITPSQMGISIRKLQQRFKKRTPRAQISYNLHIDNTLEKNRELQASLATLGWQQLKEFISLAKPLPLLRPEGIRQPSLPNFSIQQANVSNYPDILELYQQPEILPWLNCSPEDFAGMSDDETYQKFIAISNKMLIGALIAKKTSVNQNCIETLAVHPNHRKQGVASALLQYAEQWYQKHMGIEVVNIKIMAENVAALTCYERNGFRIETRKMNLAKTHTPGMTPQTTPQITPQQDADGGELMSPIERTPEILPMASAATPASV